MEKYSFTADITVVSNFIVNNWILLKSVTIILTRVVVEGPLRRWDVMVVQVKELLSPSQKCHKLALVA